MRILLCIDMPVRGRIQRRSAAALRQELSDAGFTKLQANLFAKVVGSKESLGRYLRQLQSLLPDKCNARILTLTERQYEDMKLLRGAKNAQELRVGAKRQLIF